MNNNNLCGYKNNVLGELYCTLYYVNQKRIIYDYCLLYGIPRNKGTT